MQVNGLQYCTVGNIDILKILKKNVQIHLPIKQADC